MEFTKEFFMEVFSNQFDKMQAEGKPIMAMVTGFIWDADDKIGVAAGLHGELSYQMVQQCCETFLEQFRMEFEERNPGQTVGRISSEAQDAAEAMERFAQLISDSTGTSVSVLGVKYPNKDKPKTDQDNG